MKNLYIDFDGVILDTIEITYDLMDQLNVDKTDRLAVEKFYINLDWKNLLSITPEINESIKCIQDLIEKNIFNISILTHVNSLAEIIEKVHFIRKYFHDITIIPVPKAISKTKMVHAKDAILVDDYISNLNEWQEAGGIGILFSKKLKDKGFLAINKLDQIEKVLKKEAV